MECNIDIVDQNVWKVRKKAGKKLIGKIRKRN